MLELIVGDVGVVCMSPGNACGIVGVVSEWPRLTVLRSAGVWGVPRVHAAVGDFGMCRRGETFFVGVFSVGAVGEHAGDVVEVVRQLAETPECSGLRSLGPLAMSVVGVSVGAVSGC